MISDECVSPRKCGLLTHLAPHNFDGVGPLDMGLVTGVLL